MSETAQYHSLEWPGRLVATTDTDKSNLYWSLKRCLDAFLVVILAILLLPLIILIAVAIKLDSPGPVIFTQTRVGSRRRRSGKRTVWSVQNFDIYKFRSMVENASPSVHEAYIRDFVEGRAQASPERGEKFKLTNDPRVTRVGRVLRQFSLDELPQLLNVWKGDMSLVGPRPVPPYEVALYKNDDHKRLAAPPGITGLWQVKGRCRVSFDGMIRMDLEYIRRASLWLDLKILALTVPAVLSRRGAE